MGGGGLSPGTTQFLRCRGQSLRWHSRLQYRTSLQRAQGLNRIYKGAFAPAPMFSFALNPQASQRSLGQPWLFMFFAFWVALSICFALWQRFKVWNSQAVAAYRVALAVRLLPRTQDWTS